MNVDNLSGNPVKAADDNCRPTPGPGVSVVIPAYNCAATITRTLQSVDQSISYCKDQYDGDLAAEVIIVVDKASDATYEVARRYSEPREGFHLIQNQQNYGAGPSRNIGVRHSRGGLLFFLDGDDTFFDEHIYLCVYHLQKFPHIHYAHTQIRIDENIHPQWKQSIENSVPLNICVRRWCHELIGGYLEDDVFKVCRCEDVMYRDLLRIFCPGLKINKETVQHFRYPGNALDRQMKKFSMPPDAGVDTLTDPEKAVMPEIRRIYAQRADQIRNVLAHWVNFLGNSAALKSAVDRQAD